MQLLINPSIQILISIITALHNNLELTKAFWESLLRHPPKESWEIIWIDDCSTDGTREWLRGLSDDNCQIVLNSTNLGFAANNNKGAKLAKGDFLCFLNNDIILKPDWFDPMWKAINSISNLGIVGNIQLDPFSQRIDHVGMAFNLIGDTIHPHKGYNTSSLRGEGRSCRAVTAACWLMRKDVFLENDGFDTSYRNGYEDADLCLRLGSLGFTHWVAYESRILHYVGASRGKPSRENHNRTLFLQRWSLKTSVWGQTDWPAYYLRHLVRRPAQINLIKLIDATLRVLRIRKGDSKWARVMRLEAIQAFPNK